MDNKTYKECIADMIIGKDDDNWNGSQVKWLGGNAIPMINEDDIKLLALRLTLEGPYYVLGFARLIYYAAKILNENNGKSRRSLRLTSGDIESIADNLISRMIKRLKVYSQGKLISVRKYGESSFGLRYKSN